MSLRKSPRRTRALLAANRRNSRKSTGPRTFEGKWHSSGNAIRHYRRTQFASRIPIENREGRAFEDFLSRLREAIIPAETAAGTEAVLLKAAEVWRVKRSFDRWIETRTQEDWLVLSAGAVPPPSTWRLKLRRPGLSAPDWVVTASVCLRWSRRPTRGPAQSRKRSRRSETEQNEKPDRTGMLIPRMHVIVSVHSTGPRNAARSSFPRDSRPELALSNAKGWPCREQREPTDPECERTKPESYSGPSGSENVSVSADWDPAYAEAYALAERIVGWLMGGRKRTKPEHSRKEAAYKNMSPAGESRGQNRSRSRWVTGLARGLGKVSRAVTTALTPRNEYSQLPLFQTKPESYRKRGAYKNMSKALGWLRAAALSGIRCRALQSSVRESCCRLPSD